MSQDQYGQARGSAVHGDVAPENEAEEARTEEPRSMTRFQKVASALLGDKAADGDEADQDRLAADRTGGDRPAANPPYVTERDEAAMAGRPPSQEPGHARDYWDDPETAAGHEDDAVAVTSPDTPADHPATEPDMFGTTRRTGEEPAEVPAATAKGQPGAATVADVPAARTPVGETPAGDVPAGDVPAGDVPAAAGSTGRHAAATAATAAPAAPAAPAADPNLRPGEATAALGDFSDLTYGNLVPDADQYAAQWQQVQFRFVDDPHGSVTEAADIIAQVTAKMEAAIAERQRAIEERQHAIAEQQRSLRGRWGEGTNADTENMRETLRMYKTFLDQLIGSRAS
ncbi:MAG TPA: hypothetical protein VMK84_06905 [Streptosporangiaceae bacterium]|nr:hypothetical protein [Streptosporangiaceae bacterium]